MPAYLTMFREHREVMLGMLPASSSGISGRLGQLGAMAALQKKPLQTQDSVKMKTLRFRVLGALMRADYKLTHGRGH